MRANWWHLGNTSRCSPIITHRSFIQLVKCECWTANHTSRWSYFTREILPNSLWICFVFTDTCPAWGSAQQQVWLLKKYEIVLYVTSCSFLNIVCIYLPSFQNVWSVIMFICTVKMIFSLNSVDPRAVISFVWLLVCLLLTPPLLLFCLFQNLREVWLNYPSHPLQVGWKMFYYWCLFWLGVSH